MAGPVWMSALSGIDQALWDIKGKVAGLPVVDLLGGRFREKVEVYTHFSGNSVEESVASARHIVDKGYTAIKGSVLSSNGYSFDQYFDDGRPKQTAAHFAAVREAVGPDVKLLIDCHGRFTVANCIRAATLPSSSCSHHLVPLFRAWCPCRPLALPCPRETGQSRVPATLV